MSVYAISKLDKIKEMLGESSRRLERQKDTLLEVNLTQKEVIEKVL
jgi:hypothetical protein